MTSRSAGSFLIRVEAADGGRRAGVVTSVQTGEHAPFDGFPQLAQILEQWTGSGDPQNATEEKIP